MLWPGCGDGWNNVCRGVHTAQDTERVLEDKGEPFMTRKGVGRLGMV